MMVPLTVEEPNAVTVQAARELTARMDKIFAL
jgi:hypothetical protein